MSLIRADARSLPLADRSVQCVVTSPPYWGLRDYGTAGQIGLESTPEAYVQAMVAVFREVRRVLKDDGTLWLNLGDTYSSMTKGSGGRTVKQRTNSGSFHNAASRLILDTKSKDLVGIPWRVAFALQADGWYLRSDIIWSKPNPMPESVTDRPTKAHEYIFLLTKQERYYYDAGAVAESVKYLDRGHVDASAYSMGTGTRNDHGRHLSGGFPAAKETRNKRSVWHVATQPYAGSHFATFPEALIEPCILAGSRPGDRVLDPFVGSGTVGTVCERVGRRWVGIDLAYHNLAHERTLQRGLRFDVLTYGA